MVWSRKSNNLINKIHERFQRISYKVQKTSYHNLLETHNEVKIHQSNLQVLMTDIYKIVNGVSPPFMNSLFMRFMSFEVMKTSEEQQMMKSKQLHTERHLYEQNYHMNINLQLPLKNLKWKSRNGNVTHVATDYSKNFNQILGLLIRNLVSKNVNLLCFATIFLKKLEMSSPTKKITN